MLRLHDRLIGGHKTTIEDQLNLEVELEHVNLLPVYELYLRRHVRLCQDNFLTLGETWFLLVYTQLQSFLRTGRSDGLGLRRLHEVGFFILLQIAHEVLYRLWHF